MGNINWGRVILAGLVAGAVFDLLGFLVDAVLLAPQWAQGMKALNHPDMAPHQWVSVCLLGLATGVVLIFIYAAIRPRLGAGIKTAICAGLAVWAIRSLANLSFLWAGGLFSHRLATYTTLGGIVETVIAAVAGAALYKESAG